MVSPLVIVGMPQSGASALAGALSRLGVSFGDEAEFFQQMAGDPGGRYEKQALNQFNHVCLNAFQLHTASVSPMPANWAAHPLGLVLLKDLTSILARSIRSDRRWGIKLPTASLLMPMYRAAFDQLGVRPHYVVCVRNPVDFVDSPIRWAHGPNTRPVPPLGDLAIGVWLRHTLGGLEGAGPGDFSVVLYEDLVENPRAVLDRIVALDASWSPASGEWEAAVRDPADYELGGTADPLLPSGAAFGRPLSSPATVRCEPSDDGVGGTADGGPPLQFQGTPPGDSIERRFQNYPAFVAETYDLCRALAVGEGSYERLRDVIAEFELWREMFARPGIPGTRVGLAWTERGDVRTVQVPFLPAGDWQSIRMEIDAPPSTRLSGLLYGQPCRVWVRRCAWVFGGREEAATLTPGPGSHIQNLEGVVRLDAAYEAGQISVRTPQRPGPYTLEIEFLLEAGPQISIETASRLSTRLRQCIAMHQQISSGGGC